jgi:hypothetical protein
MSEPDHEKEVVIQDQQSQDTMPDISIFEVEVNIVETTITPKM